MILGNELFCKPFTITNFLSENIYEKTAKLLFLSVKWIQNLPSFLQVCIKLNLIFRTISKKKMFINEIVVVTNQSSDPTRNILE